MFIKRVFHLIILAIVICLPLISSSSTGMYWKPSTLAELREDTKSDSIHIFDPENLLGINYEQKKEINEIALNLKKEKNFDIFIYTFSYMHDNYGKDGDKLIDQFANDLSYQVLNGKEIADHYSIFIILAIGDRQSRIRTGKLVRSYLQDSKCHDYLKSIIPYLKSKNYSTALVSLINSINNRINTKYQLLSDLLEFLYNLIFSWIILIIFFVIISIFYKEKKLSESSEEKLKKIKKITENGKQRREILETVCIICLEGLVENKKEDDNRNLHNVHTNCDTGLNSQTGSINPPEEEKENLEGENNLNKENASTEKNFIAKLECGHTFHSQCISSWMTKQNKCPVCRDKIDKEEENNEDIKPNSTTSTTAPNSNRTAADNLTRFLVEVQTDIHADFNLLYFNYGTNSFSWNYRQPPRTASSGSSGSFSWGGGGASIKW